MRMDESRRDGEAMPAAELKSGEKSPGSEGAPCKTNGPALEEQLGSEEKKIRRRSLLERFSYFRTSIRNPPAEKEIEDQSFPDKKPQASESHRTSLKQKASVKSLKKPDTEQRGTEGSAEKADVPMRKGPLSVMQIHELIQSKKFQEAFSSIKLLEDELLVENNSKKHEDNGTEYSRRAMDVHLLYSCLFDVMKSVVEDALGQANCDGQLVASVVDVINEEERAHSVHGREAASSETNGLGMPKKWKALWRESVSESIRKRVHSVPIPPRKENKSWLAVHLGYLKTNVHHDLLKIKHSVKNHYPEDYNVCCLYVANFHSAISSHLQENIVNKSLEFEELYALLDWVLNTYCSEALMGNPELKPEANIESLPPLLEPPVLKGLKDDYCKSLRKKMNKQWENILNMETEKWNKEEEPALERCQNQDSYHLPIYIDIQEMIEQHVRVSGKLCKDLESPALQICLEGLQQFIKRLEREFMDWDKEKKSSKFVPYLIVYINSFLELRIDTEKGDASDLKENMTGVLTMAIQNFKDYFFQRLQLETREFVNGVRKHMVKEYIAQIMHQKMSLKRSNRAKAAQKMMQEAEEMKRVTAELDLDSEWPFLAVHLISEIVGIKRKEKIEKNLGKIYHEYPDISEEHVLAILHLQGTRRRKKLSIVEYFKRLQKERPNMGNEDKRTLFAEIEVPSTFNCFSVIG
ncbi:exocyst complex component 3-like protein 4 isoform X2 [Rhinatrema bivittatum]|uniref:exocyst complex component 3-like protein 4 isoform X2 n=1 Tax=Rhinatrema bivittatum TaxID=194408 RepID=UPI00112CF34E|nr:exocyst complex component 3-like protein 4 isoform X2 [Rhinatrema bivittatum]